MSESLDQFTTKRKAVLRSLKVANGWVPTSTLKVIDHRFSARLYELRQEGHRIEMRKGEAEDCEWRYIEQIAVESTERGWQEAYYKSKHWRAKRRARLKHDGWRCVNCHATDCLHVHHWRYDLFEERLLDLMTLCEKCHDVIHDTVCVAFPKSVTREIYERLPGFKVA